MSTWDDDETESDEPATGELDALPAEAIDGEPVPDERPATTRQALREVYFQETHSPFPDQAWLRAAEELSPGTTNELVNDFLQERKHFRAMDRKAAKLDERSVETFVEYQNAQLRLAGGIAILVIVAAVVLTLVGEPLYGFALVLAELAGLASVFLLQRRRGTPRVDQRTARDLEAADERQQDEAP